MSRPDLAFWITIVPCVLIWNFARVPILEYLAGADQSAASHSRPDIWVNTAFAGVLGLLAGYGASLAARPEYLRGAGNIAFGLLVCLGIQNIVDYRDAGLPIFYFVLVPVSAVAAALFAGISCRLARGVPSSA